LPGEIHGLLPRHAVEDLLFGGVEEVPGLPSRRDEVKAAPRANTGGREATYFSRNRVRPAKVVKEPAIEAGPKKGLLYLFERKRACSVLHARVKVPEIGSKKKSF